MISSLQKRNDHGRKSLVSLEEDVVDHHFRIYQNKFEIFNYYINDINVTKIFHNYHIASTAVVNNLSTKTNIHNFSKFL
jgi:hypothetical protein